MFPHFFFSGWFSVSLSNLPENQTRHIPHTRAHKSGKRLQLLRDSGGRGQVIRQSGPEQEFRPPAADPGWMAAGGQSGLGAEELRQPAAALQQVRLQKVLWEKRPLRCWMCICIFFFCSPIKGFGTITNVQRTCRRHRQTTTDYIYDIRRASTIVLFYCFFYDNHFCSLKRSSLWVISECLYYFFLNASERQYVCVCDCACVHFVTVHAAHWKTVRRSYLLLSCFVVLCLLC